MRLSVIIVSATDDAGLEDYFADANINLLPLLDKTLIEFLIDDLHKPEVKKYIENIILIVSDTTFNRYEEIIESNTNLNLVDKLTPVSVKNQLDTDSSNIVTDKYPEIKLIKRPTYSEKGILAAIEKTIKDEKDCINGPVFIAYGDTILKDQAYRVMLQKAEELEGNPDAPPKWGVIAFIDVEDRIKKINEFEKNRWGFVRLDKNTIIPLDIKEMGLSVEQTGSDKQDIKFREINSDGIIDIVYKPTYIDLFEEKCKLDDDENNTTSGITSKICVESGMMILSQELLQALFGINNRDPLGLKSIINSARLSLIYDNFYTCGIIFDSDHWLDINYPWEYLMANDYLGELRLSKVKDECNEEDDNNKENMISDNHEEDAEEEVHANLRPGAVVIKSQKKLKRIYQKYPSLKIKEQEELKHDPIKYQYYNEYDEPVYGIHSNVIIDGCLTIVRDKPDDELKIYLGRNCCVRGNCVIKNGARIRGNATIVNSIICEDALVDSYALIDHSIIMSGARILAGAVVPYSIIGRNAIMGGKTLIACEKLKSNGDPVLSKYYANHSIVYHTCKFGAIVGDNVKIGISSIIQPGRKIGIYSRLAPGSKIIHNCPPFSIVEG